MRPMVIQSRYASLLIPTALLAAVAGGSAAAVEGDLRIVPQLMVGSAGVEPGVALEWRGSPAGQWVIRPEVLLSNDDRPGVGIAVLYDLSSAMELPSRQAFAVGPRVVYHNSDEDGWEADALATWSFELSDDVARPWRHAIGALGALGVSQDREHDDSDIAVTVGAFYSFRF